MKTKTFFFFFFYLAIAAGYGSIRRIKQQYIFHDNLTPINASYPSYSHYSRLTHDRFPQASGERREFRGPSRQRHSYAKLRGGREIRNKSGRRWSAEQLGRAEEKLVRRPAIKAEQRFGRLSVDHREFWWISGERAKRREAKGK